MSDSLALYNEIDPYAADWLRNLIAAGHIAAGVVDTRSIVDLTPEYVGGFSQVHFFAGIGVWSYALRRAGFTDSAPVWTGSCPCQPFSAAGKGGGFADERHLWPHMHYLIEQCRPRLVLGEQVASKDGLAWFDLVQFDLENTGYTAAAVDSCSAGFGAPHIRQRLYWMAYAADTGLVGWRPGEASDGRAPSRLEPERLCNAGQLAHAACSGRGQTGCDAACDLEADGGRSGNRTCDAGAHGEPRGLADDLNQQRSSDRQSGISLELDTSGWFEDSATTAGLRSNCPTGPTNGFWRNPDWLLCRDGKWRPVESGTFPLADGSAFRMGSGSTFEGKSRVGMLRGYGNAINAEHATAFCEAARDFLSGR